MRVEGYEGVGKGMRKGLRLEVGKAMEATDGGLWRGGEGGAMGWKWRLGGGRKVTYMKGIDKGTVKGRKVTEPMDEGLWRGGGRRNGGGKVRWMDGYVYGEGQGVIK